MSANERLRDLALRRQIDLRRLSAGELAKLQPLLEKADAELVDLLRARLPRLAGKPLDFTAKRWLAMLRDVKALRARSIAQLEKDLRAFLEELAGVESSGELGILASAMPIEDFAFSSPSAALLRSILEEPFALSPTRAVLLEDWIAGLASSDLARINEILQLGALQGDTVDAIIRRIAGTKVNRYADGVLAVTRRAAAAIVRTAMNRVSNRARELVWEENADIIEFLVWVATLDGRTTAVCQARDGKLVVVGGGKPPRGRSLLSPQSARPPAHVSCRSLMIAVFDADRIAEVMPDRPFVRDERTRRVREVDFRAAARERVGLSNWRAMSPSERNAAIRVERGRWADEAIGTVPAATTYQQWLKMQPATFQDDVLGPARGRLFRRGDLSLDKFVDKDGSQLTLEELARRQPQAFDDAGL